MNNSFFKLSAAALPHIADTLKALGHPQRLRLLEALADGEKSVGRLAELLDIPQAIVSQQLRIMRSCGVVCQRRYRTNSLYSLAHEGLIQLLACLENCQEHCLIPVQTETHSNDTERPE
ncbi:MAG TPA: metalloregulator ArsR/SmtB family transcription factor [Candidatus Ozemobacteraceae bacterium]|nr:metalloregulator ArsR/SmtB family transcription factor [Candidatus Ozemobacteraceae bacterium]